MIDAAVKNPSIAVMHYKHSKSFTERVVAAQSYSTKYVNHKFIKLFLRIQIAVLKNGVGVEGGQTVR